MQVNKVLIGNDRAFYKEQSSSLSRRPRVISSKPVKYNETTYGTKNYSNGLQDAFNRVKHQVFFNPDMQYFVTLTYKGKNHTYDHVLHDLKMFFKNQRRKVDSVKYVAVMEYQKRGSIHVHLITNKLNFVTNKNNYLHLPDWKHGFSSVLHISSFDDNFRPYLYLFKYMKKSQRIGKSFVYASRNLNNFKEISPIEFDSMIYEQVAVENTIAMTPTLFPIYYKKYYLQKR